MFFFLDIYNRAWFMGNNLNFFCILIGTFNVYSVYNRSLHNNYSPTVRDVSIQTFFTKNIFLLLFVALQFFKLYGGNILFLLSWNIGLQLLWKRFIPYLPTNILGFFIWICVIYLITTVVKFLHENSSQFPFDGH